MSICGFRWNAPRLDVPESTPVLHVCYLPDEHKGTHACSCGRVYVVRF